MPDLRLRVCRASLDIQFVDIADGLRLEDGSTVVNATEVTVVSDTKITCQFVLPGTLGKYDVVVKNPDGQEARLNKSFSVTNICGQGAG